MSHVLPKKTTPFGHVLQLIESYRDGGQASRKKLEAIRAAGLRYLVNDSRSGRKALAE